MKKIKRVIFFFATKFNQRDYHRFGFDIIQKRGFKVEIWDFSPWLKPDYDRSYNPHDPLEYDGYKIVHNVEQAKAAISKLSSNDFVFDPHLISREKFIYDKIKIKGIKNGAFLLGLLPVYNNNFRTKKILILLISNPLQTFKKVFKKIPFKRIFRESLPAIDFLLTGGMAAKNDHRYKTNENTTIIKSHALDYDRYLEEEMRTYKKNDQENEPFSLFLDEDMPFHPDYVHTGIKPYCPANIYFPEINNFFLQYERETGLKIIIAGHPRTDYKSRGNPYGNRQIITGETVNLVKASTHVLLHASTAINYAILYKKPIILIDSDKYSQTLRNHIYARAKALLVKPINITKSLSHQYNQPKVNDMRYREYKERYIKEPETPDKPVWEIFCDYLDTLNG